MKLFLIPFLFLVYSFGAVCSERNNLDLADENRGQIMANLYAFDIASEKKKGFKLNEYFKALEWFEGKRKDRKITQEVFSVFKCFRICSR